jgi:ankyrin repeat protein
MKLVREYINEKFTNNDSDPIKDLGIGMFEQIKKFLKTGLGVEYSFSDISSINGGLMLAFCADGGKTEYVRYLIENGANIHYQDDYAFRYSVKCNYIEIVKLLLDVGIDIKDVGISLQRFHIPYVIDYSKEYWKENKNKSEMIKLLKNYIEEHEEPWPPKHKI